MGAVTFRQYAADILKDIMDQIEMQDAECLFDIDNEGDMIWINTSKGQYVINVNTAKSEIWLSSPVSGPYHFALIESDWIDKGGDSLFHILSDELTSISKQDIIIKNLDEDSELHQSRILS